MMYTYRSLRGERTKKRKQEQWEIEELPGPSSDLGKDLPLPHISPEEEGGGGGRTGNKKRSRQKKKKKKEKREQEED